MRVSGKGGDDFIPAPKGNWPARCIDVADLGMVETDYGIKHQCRLVWVLACEDELGNALTTEDGKPFLAFRKYTASIHPKSSLGKDLVTWRGRNFTPEELIDFEMDDVIGAPAMIQVVHKTADDGMRVYANVASVTPLARQMQDAAPPMVPDYVRWNDRPENQAEGSQPHCQEEFPTGPQEHHEGWSDLEQADTPF